MEKLVEAPKNVPYVRQLDENGELLNPIDRIYRNIGPNRRERRWSEPRFLNNRGTYPIQVLKATKYRKVLQRYFKKDGSIGIIKHWLEN
jgi:hypothetical protein